MGTYIEACLRNEAFDNVLRSWQHENLVNRLRDDSPVTCYWRPIMRQLELRNIHESQLGIDCTAFKNGDIVTFNELKFLAGAIGVPVGSIVKLPFTPKPRPKGPIVQLDTSVLKVAMEQHDMKPTALSELSGVTPTTIRNILAGTPCFESTAHRVASVLGLQPEDVIM
jgi:hypothetical protein